QRLRLSAASAAVPAPVGARDRLKPAPTGTSLRGVRVVDLGGEDEVAFGQAVDFVGPDFHPDLAPGEKDIGVMPLLLRDSTYLVGEVQGGLEVRKFEFLLDVVIIHHRQI